MIKICAILDSCSIQNKSIYGYMISNPFRDYVVQRGGPMQKPKDHVL